MKGAPLNIIGLPSIYPNAREITFGGATGENKINLKDNLASALEIFEGSNSYLKFITTNGSEQIDLGKNTTINGNFALEGLSTGRNVIRSSKLRFTPGGTPGTNITIVNASLAANSFNSPTITGATNLGKSGSDGSFALSSDGLLITMDITEAIVGILGGVNVQLVDLNSSSTSELYTYFAEVSSGNMIIGVIKRGDVAQVDWTTILDSGDRVDLIVSYVTSS